MYLCVLKSLWPCTRRTILVYFAVPRQKKRFLADLHILGPEGWRRMNDAVGAGVRGRRRRTNELANEAINERDRWTVSRVVDCSENLLKTKEKHSLFFSWHSSSWKNTIFSVRGRKAARLFRNFRRLFFAWMSSRDSKEMDAEVERWSKWSIYRWIGWNGVQWWEFQQ